MHFAGKSKLKSFFGDKKKLLILLLFFTAVIFVRFYNIAGTTRFTRDESNTLRMIYDIYYVKHFTFIGPIDSTATIIYPSLTLYLMLPFVAAFSFTPQSPAYSTAFFGVLTVGLILLIAAKINRKLLIYTAALSVVWFPLLESSRWAWNPHFIPFFSFLAILLVLLSNNLTLFLAGLSFGAVFHLHYLSFVAFAAFFICFTFTCLLKKEYRKPVILAIGFFLTIIPFIIFDLRHPPGLFFNHFVQNNMVRTDFSSKILRFVTTFPKNFYSSFFYMAQTKIGVWFMVISVLLLFIYDVRFKFKNLIYFAPLLPQIALISLLPVYGNRYFLPALPFFFVWLILKRGKAAERLAKFTIIVIFLGSLLGLKTQLTKPILVPSAGVVNSLADFIKLSVVAGNRKNVNLAILASPDMDPLGVIYRHTLYAKGINVLLPTQYAITDNLYIVSTALENTVRKDPANVMDGFRNGPLSETYQLQNTQWKVYLFNRY